MTVLFPSSRSSFPVTSFEAKKPQWTSYCGPGKSCDKLFLCLFLILLDRLLLIHLLDDKWWLFECLLGLDSCERSCVKSCGIAATPCVKTCRYQNVLLVENPSNAITAVDKESMISGGSYFTSGSLNSI